MAGVLILNATYEPIGVVSLRRSIGLWLSNKVDVLEHRDSAIRGANLTLQAPSVIRLRYYVKVPHHRIAPLSRKAVFARDAGRCQYCGRPADTIDHVLAKSRGGPHCWENVVAACRECNSRKGDRLLAETNLALRRRPTAPRRYAWIGAAAGRPLPPEWSSYLERFDRLAA